MIELITSFLIGTVATVGGFFGGQEPVAQPLGAFDDPFISIQLADSPTNGDCLTTDGTNNVWDTCAGGGGGSSLHVDGTGFVYPADGDYHSAPYYVATSTTATSTFPLASFTSAVNFLGDYVTNTATWIRSKFTAGTGIDITSGTIALNSATQTSLGLADSATQPGDNISDLTNDAGYITSSSLHDALTVTDSSEIDFTLTGQDLTAALIAGSIDETKLDTSTNASLDLADSALQDITTESIGDLSDVVTSVAGATASYLPNDANSAAWKIQESSDSVSPPSALTVDVETAYSGAEENTASVNDTNGVADLGGPYEGHKILHDIQQAEAGISQIDFTVKLSSNGAGGGATMTLYIWNDTSSSWFSTSQSTSLNDGSFETLTYSLTTNVGDYIAANGNLYYIVHSGTGGASHGSTLYYANAVATYTQTPVGGDVLIYDGTDSFDSKAISGDLTINSSGVATISASAVDLSTDVTGNLAITNLNSGTNASSTSFWRGDGVWAVPAGGGGGTIDGTGVADQLTYWVDTDTLGALATSTYPSLTELSYNKGVTSAIQTQLNAKAPLASPTFTGTVTLPTGLTGVLRADSGVVSTDSDVTDLVDNLTVSQLADGTDGQLITWDAAGAPATVSTGTAGQLLTSNGAGTAPTFQTLSGFVESPQAGVSNYTPNSSGSTAWDSVWSSTSATALDGDSSETEINGTGQTQLSTDDGSDYNPGGVAGGNSKGVKAEILVAESPASISDITLTWNGYGESFGSPFTVTLYVWNDNSSSWESLDSDSGLADFTLTGSITSNIANYIDGDSKLHFMAFVSSTGITGTVFYNDFLGAAVTYGPAGGDILIYDGVDSFLNKPVSGAFTMATTGVATLSSGIDATKIADGSISNTEFQYLNNASSNIQTQLDGLLSMRHATSTITVCSSVFCDYQTDGTADEVQINLALADVKTNGGAVQLFAETYNTAAAISLIGATANDVDNPTIKLIGLGQDATTIAAASNINGIEITNQPKYEIADMTITIAGTGDGIHQTAGTERGNWQSLVRDIFIKTDFTTITSDSWGIYMESPFRMRFENIEMNGVYNGMWLTSHTESFNPGNLSVDRIFVDLWSSATNGVGIKLSTTAVTSTGHFNLATFNRVDIAGASGLTGSIGVHLAGATSDPGGSYYGEVRQNSFTNMNIEDVQTAFKLEAASDNTFTDINYTRVLNNGTVFDLDDESLNNKFENTYLDANTATSITVNVINDQANDTAQPNIFTRIVGFATTTAALNATTSASTIIKHVDLAEGSPVVDTDLVEKDYFIGRLDTSAATVTRYTQKSFTFPSTATTTTATTTVQLGSAYEAQNWENVQCNTSSGTTGYQLTDGTNLMDFLQATSTVSRFGLTTNNSFTAQEKIFINVGPLTASYISCTANVKVNP